MLLYDQGGFFRVLEGVKEVVESLFSLILKDKRHEKVTKIIFEAIPKRDFNEWSMGYSSISRNELNTIYGANDFFEEATCLSSMDISRAKKLLTTFSSGRWRVS